MSWRPIIGANPKIAHRVNAAFSLVEVAIAVALLGLVAATAIATLVSLNKNAVATRVLGNARDIVQRNIEAAVGAPFNSASVPTILAVTSGSSGVNWDDSGGTGPVTIYADRDGSTAVTGTLKRIVSSETNTAGADLRRVTFRLSYSLFGRPMSYELTTIRAMDR